jgi:hypothetical protein
MLCNENNVCDLIKYVDKGASYSLHRYSGVGVCTGGFLKRVLHVGVCMTSWGFLLERCGERDVEVLFRVVVVIEVSIMLT